MDLEFSCEVCPGDKDVGTINLQTLLFVQFCLPEPAGGDFLDTYIKMQHKLVVKSMDLVSESCGCHGYLVINMANK
ncbi:hypothetical protein Cadr_000002991 [Camelus dromedarius]|uniref:Uncharacterized protein n=1 Tax=Camelus dromedarius TaxID=9838 RepID=A0A5N4C5M8_CAMDR|nr:hypothetical protein Cadr_000002991 [Camelus dromedarius]